MSSRREEDKGKGRKVNFLFLVATLFVVIIYSLLTSWKNELFDNTSNWNDWNYPRKRSVCHKKGDDLINRSLSLVPRLYLSPSLSPLYPLVCLFSSVSFSLLPSTLSSFLSFGREFLVFELLMLQTTRLKWSVLRENVLLLQQYCLNSLVIPSTLVSQEGTHQHKGSNYYY